MAKSLDKFKKLETLTVLGLALLVLHLGVHDKMLEKDVHPHLLLFFSAGLILLGLFKVWIVGFVAIGVNFIFDDYFTTYHLTFVGAGLLLSEASPYKLDWLIVNGWLKLGELMGFVMSKVILGTVFFIFLTPLALVYRIFKSDPLKLRRKKDTYFETRDYKYKSDDLKNVW